MYAPPAAVVFIVAVSTCTIRAQEPPALIENVQSLHRAAVEAIHTFSCRYTVKEEYADGRVTIRAPCEYWRSGDAVRALATPDSPLPLADKIKAGIDSVPTGTTHCVRITPITDRVYSVVIAEMRPGQAPGQFSQTITTKDIDGRWFVDSIS